MKEITEAITSMKPNKAPGFDGLSVEFYKVFGSEVNDLVLHGLNEAFEKGCLSYSQRKGVITLFFKGDGDKQELEKLETNKSFKYRLQDISDGFDQKITKCVSRYY